MCQLDGYFKGRWVRTLIKKPYRSTPPNPWKTHTSGTLTPHLVREIAPRHFGYAPDLRLALSLSGIASEAFKTLGKGLKGENEQ